MLEKIKQISNDAKNAIDVKLGDLNEESAGYNDLILIKNAYMQLDALIQAAEDQHATIGSYILLRQLSQNEQELNAAILLRNFLKVLDYPVSTTLDMSQSTSEQSGIDIAKMFAMAPLGMMFSMVSIFIPVLLISLYPWLMLLISALPLAITYACDEPFSMARFYQEMAWIEKELAFSVLFTITTAIIFAFSPEVPILIAGIILLSALSTELFLLWHSNNLQSKHEHLRPETINIKESVRPFINSSSSNFFKTQTNISSDEENLREMEQRLFLIK